MSVNAGLRVDMGSRSRLRAEILPAIGSSIRVSGTARIMGD